MARRYEFEMPRMLSASGYYGFGIGKMHWFPQKSLHGFDGTLVDGDFGEAHAAAARRHYYANISFIDDQVGAILAALKKKGFLDDALILFASDHGDMLGDHFHWRKTYPYQGSARVPMLMQWPAAWTAGIARGTALRQPVELRDILPTFLDAAGADIPSKMDGRSLLSLVRNPGAAWRPAIDLEHARIYRPGNYWGGLTDGRIKYVWYYPDGREQLFDLEKDPGETRDVAREAACRDALEVWRARFAAHLAERGEGFVKSGRPAIRKESLLYSPLYPVDEPPSR